MKAFTLLLFGLFGAVVALANDVRVSNATLTGQNVAAGANNVANFTMVQFDLAWSNSWKVNTGPSNWDAVWVFVKYRIEGGSGCTPGSWQHATLSITGGDHSITTNNGVVPSIDPSSDGKGAFLYRNANGTGNINWAGVRLRWNYGADGLLDACNVSIKVFAIEMVYVPQGSFFAGDGTGAGIVGQFESVTSGAAFQVTSEGAVTLGGGGAGSLGNRNRAGQAVADDFTNVLSQTLPAAFPKGFFQFYSMKYEISQEQYAEFLNVLTPAQQLIRHGATVVNRFITNGGTPPARNGIKCTTLPVIATGVVGIYSADLNNNGVFNETTDGQNVASAFMEGQDLLAYLDWAALRPMTELEYEKASRGTLPAVPNEYAWGSAAVYATSYAPLLNNGMGTELPTAPAVGGAGNAAYSATTGPVLGPVRVGIFAIAASSRVDAGASYYGIMEMTGNVWEIPVGVGQVAGRSFTGLHGNGALDAAGNANADFWPGVNGNSNWTVANTAYAGTTGSNQVAGLQFRGGSWVEVAFLRLSDRQYSFWTGLNGRDQRIGGRGVRTAP